MHICYGLWETEHHGQIDHLLGEIYKMTLVSLLPKNIFSVAVLDLLCLLVSKYAVCNRLYDVKNEDSIWSYVPNKF